MTSTPVKRLLMVANYFPPMASGGIARQLRFLRYLPEFGWETTVLSCKATGPVPDPEGVRIVRAAAPGLESAFALARRVAPHRAAGGSRPADAGVGGPGSGSGAGTAASTGPDDAVPAPSPGPGPSPADLADDGDPAGLTAGRQRYARRAWINNWFFVPDQYMGWIPPGILKGRELLRSEHYDAILSSYPRGSTHLIAAALAAHSGLPWLADYRDPWPTHQYRIPPTELHRRAHFWLEGWALGHATVLTATNEPIADDLRRRYPSLAPVVHVLPNGFDRAEDVQPVSLGKGFWLVHTGRLYSRGDKVLDLLNALVELPDDVKVCFVGVDGPRIKAHAEAIGIGHRVRVEPFVQRPLALGYQCAADALLLITGDAPEALSSKVFEYLVAGRPVFALTPTYSCAADLLRESHGGVVAGDAPGTGGGAAAGGAGLAGALADFVARVRAGELGAADPAVIDRYDGRALTGQLAGYLDQMIGADTGGGGARGEDATRRGTTQADGDRRDAEAQGSAASDHDPQAADRG